MNFKDFGLREWLVIIFIILGLAAFVFEDFDFVAGATFTSEGFKEALDMAIDDIKNQE